MKHEHRQEDWSLELNLNRMTVVEELAHPESFKEYKNIVVVLSQIKDFYLSEAEVLKAVKASNIETVLQEYPHILKTNAHWKNEKGTFDKKYIDIAPEYSIQPTDPYYDIFFARKLRQLDLLEIDAFLDYHFEHYYNSNIQEFARFLKICVRKHTTTFLTTETIQTIHEWIAEKEKQQVNLQGTPENQSVKERKNKTTREPQDKKTCLNQEQTVLLMHYLQQARVFLKDEDLQKIEFGQAFEILTGYSQHTLRQKLGKVSSTQNKENLKEIGNLLTRLQIAIDKDLKQK